MYVYTFLLCKKKIKMQKLKQYVYKNSKANFLIALGILKSNMNFLHALQRLR